MGTFLKFLISIRVLLTEYGFFYRIEVLFFDENTNKGKGLDGRRVVYTKT